MNYAKVLKEFFRLKREEILNNIPGFKEGTKTFLIVCGSAIALAILFGALSIGAGYFALWLFPETVLKRGDLSEIGSLGSSLIMVLSIFTIVLWFTVVKFFVWIYKNWKEAITIVKNQKNEIEWKIK